MEARANEAVELTEPLDNHRVLLLHDEQAILDDRGNNYDKQNEEYEASGHGGTFLLGSNGTMIQYAAPAKSNAGGASPIIRRKRRCLMLKEILTLILSTLPNWLAVLLMIADLHDRKKNKRVDEYQEE